MTQRHIVLVGLSGSGKSTVGLALASTLDAPYVDVDARIESETGRTIRQIFEEDGEDGFRELESRYVADAIATAPQIIVPGGGWVTQPGALEAVDEAVLVYLKVSPSVAAARLAGDDSRPLLTGGSPAGLLDQQLEHRAASYEAAQFVITTDDRSVREVTLEIEKLARHHGGW